MKTNIPSNSRRVLLALVLLLCTTLVQADILVHGHRGARAVRPENTLEAFRYALEVGVDVLELDLGVSKDNVLVISHDPFVSPFCSKNGKPSTKKIPIRSLTLSQLKEWDCSSTPNPRFPEQVLQPGQKMSTLDEFFEMVKNTEGAAAKTVRFNIETKIFRPRPELTPTAEAFTRLLLDKIQAHGVSDRTIVQSFDYRTLKWVKKLAPHIETSQLTENNFVDLVAAAKSIDADYLSPHWQTITREMVQEYHSSGIKVAPWTANTVDSWDALITMGVDEIITDDPAGLIKHLQQKELRP